MIFNLLQIVLVLITFFTIKYLAYKVTDEWGLPEFIRYEPWICFKCLSFWTLISIFLVSGLICHLWITMGVGILLTVLDTIALIIHQKNYTVKIEEYEMDK